MTVGPQPYTPSPIEFDANADFVLKNGAIAIIGNDGMESVIAPMCEIFESAHPGIRFDLTMRGSATAIPALGVGASLFAPMSRDPWEGDRASFKSIKGYLPTPIRFGYTGHGPRKGARTPPALWIHKDNPLKGLTLGQIEQIFASGHPEGDLNTWGQLGLDGHYGQRRIHVFGCRDDGKFASGFRDAWLGGRRYKASYEPLKNRVEVLKAVSTDPFSIGAIGWYDPELISDNLKVVPIAKTEGDNYYTPQLDHVSQGLYPLSAHLSIFADIAPGQKLSPLVREFARIALSSEGQTIVAAQTHSDEGYVPLAAARVGQETDLLAAL